MVQIRLWCASGRAADIDNALHDIEALTTGAAYAAEGALNAPAPRLSWNVRRDPPPGAKRAKRYHGEIAVDWASVSASKSARATTDDLARMAALGPVLSQAQVASGSGDARRLTSKERFAQIGERGVPVVWARVGLTDGILAEAPGRKAFIDDAPSVKSLPWFTASRGKRGAVWSGPTLDPRGLGQVITCTVPWFHDTGKIAGAAALDVSLSWLNERVKPPPGGQAYVIDAEGHVLVHTEMDPMAAPERIPLDHAEHAEHITAKEPGWHEASDGTLAVWSPLQTTGWTYLVIAPADVLTERLAP